MLRTSTSFSLLQATAAIATLATLLWSMGVPMFRFAEAANVISFSSVLSDSAPEASANHTISFVTPSGVAAGQEINLFFAPEFQDIDALQAVDLDLVINGVEADLVDGTPSGTDWGVVASGSQIDITSALATVPQNATVTIRIGTNATNGGAGTNQITNPASTGSYEITIEVGADDTGATLVAIVDSVTVTAAVETRFDFTVTGVNAGLNVNGDSTTATTTSTEVPFGVLAINTPSIAAQDLQVVTNAANGFVVTVQVDQQLTSSNGAVIDGYADGSYLTIPDIWNSPAEDINDDKTWGHWGLTTDDETLTELLDDPFAGSRYASASTTPVEIFRHTGPTNGTVQGAGTTRVGYKVEISALQEAANDYTATLTYVATPVF
jgi:hypothetical protein